MARLALCLPLVVGLACGGLEFSSPSFEDVNAAEVIAAGYTVPSQAEHVYVRDFSQIDIRSTWFRFELPASAFDEVRAEYEASPDHEPLHRWEVPDAWPNFDQFQGGEAPPWWNPRGEACFRRVSPHDGAHGTHDLTRVSQTAFDVTDRVVWVWSWEWQWWEL